MARRSHMRVKSVKTTYKECDVSKPFEVRNNYIESRIELRFRYFNRLNDAHETPPDIDILRRKI